VLNVFEFISLVNPGSCASIRLLGSFLGILLENLGIPLPETVTLVGFLAGSGQLNYWLVLGSAILGAVTCGY